MSEFTREEIELMAYAAGYEIEVRPGLNGIWRQVDYVITDDAGAYYEWRPWEDKQQAFDLMCDARISVSLLNPFEVRAVMKGNNGYISEQISESAEIDYGIVMRTICRMAVDLGRAYKNHESGDIES